MYQLDTALKQYKKWLCAWIVVYMMGNPLLCTSAPKQILLILKLPLESNFALLQSEFYQIQ